MNLASASRAAALSASLLLSASLVAPSPSAFAGDDINYAKLLEQKSPTVVTVKFVLKVRVSMGGQSNDDEQNADTRGVVVDPSGLVMVSSDAFEAGGGMFRRMRGRGGPAIEANATPQDLKVMFGSEEKEHEAVLVATDKKLGLAFVQILAPEGTLAAADLGKGAAVTVGQTIVGVTRKGRGFDSAAVVERALVVGKIEKPRPMWALDGSAVPALPMYDAEGRAVGVPSMQQGVEGADEGGGRGGGFASMIGGAANMGVFLLPIETVTNALEQAKKRVPDAVAKAKESRETKPAEPAMDGAAPTTPPETPKTPAPDAPKTPDKPK